MTRRFLLLSLLVGIIFSLIFGLIPYASAVKIPHWFNDVYTWYYNGQISKEEIVDALKFLTKDDAILTTKGDDASKTRSFGCQELDGEVTCDLLMNDFESYQISGKSEKIFILTSQRAEFEEGKFANALVLKGNTGDFLNIPNKEDLNPLEFSVSFWVQRNKYENAYGHVVSHINSNSDAGWTFDLGNTEDQSISFKVANTDGKTFSPKDVSIPDDTFANIIGVFDGSSVRVFKDGILIGKSDFNGDYEADPNVPMRIGMAAYCDSCAAWSGKINDLRLYNRVLSDHEIEMIANSEDVTDGIVGHWIFKKEITDDTGNNNDATTLTPAVSMAFAPDGRLFFSEKNTGNIRIMKDDKVLEEPFAQISDLEVDSMYGLLGITIDPYFETNHFVYAFYTATDPQTDKPVDRVARFTDKDNTGTDMTIILDKIPALKGMHTGGALAFAPDDKLYITVGDGYSPAFAQDPDTMLGKILRINRDGTIPEDNPNPGSPIYNTGHRNMYGIAFDNKGFGIVTENGENEYDEINSVEKGANYGWPAPQFPDVPPELADNLADSKPLRSYKTTIAPTQAIYYDGDKFPELKGKFLFGSYNNGKIYALKIDSHSKQLVEEIKIAMSENSWVPKIAIAASPEGDIYFGSYQIFKLESLDVTEKKGSIQIVDINSPAGIAVRSVKLSDSGKMVLDLVYGKTVSSSSTIKVKFPKELLNGITSVTDEKHKPVDYTIEDKDSPNEYNNLSIKYPGPKHTELIINTE